MTKRILSFFAYAAAMTMFLACEKNEKLPSGPGKDPEPETPAELKLGQVELSFDISIEDFENVTKAPASLKDGAELAFALDGSSKPAGKLKYDASTGKWSKVTLNDNIELNAKGGKVSAIHSATLSIDTAADGAECKGGIVYTDAGTYTVNDKVLSLKLNLDRHAESRLTLKGIDAKAKVMGLTSKTLASFKGMQFTETEATGEGTYDAKAKTLTVEGCLPVDESGRATIKIQYLEGENAGKMFTRELEGLKKNGESINISGPEAQADQWTDAGRLPTAVKFRIPDTETFYQDGQEIITSYDRTSVKIAEIVVLPEDADKNVTVSSSNQSAAGQAEDGFIYAWGTGKTTITVTTSNGISNTLTVDVLDKYITVAGFSYEVLDGGTLQLKANSENPYSGDVVIPDTAEYSGHQLPVTSIAGDTFKGDQITSITFGKNVQTLKEKAINNCSNLTKVKINKNLHQIDRYNRNFIYCDKINSIEIEEGNEYLLLENGVLYCRDDLLQDPHNRCAFVMPNYTEPIVISSNTVEIDAGSIYNVQTTSITIPRSVKDMGRSLFGGSKTKLESVKLEWTWSEWYSMKFDGIFRSAIFNLQNEFFNSHPSKSTVKIYVPSQYVASYRQTGCTWLLAIGNDTSRIIGY